MARATGGFYLYSSANLASGMKPAPGSGSWSTSSDRTEKTDVIDIDAGRILAKVAALPISEWRSPFAAEICYARGTMAQPLISRSRYSFTQTVERLASAIHAAGGTLFATIDQQAAAEAVGLTLRPTTLLIFGNARGGTPFMEAFPLIALELPLKVLVWEADGVVSVAAVLPSLIAERYRIVGHADLLAALDAGVRELVASVE